MALRQLDLESHLKPISELRNHTIEKGDPDPRGWSVVSAGGESVGSVDDLIVDTNSMKVRYLVVDLRDALGTGSTGDTVLLDASDIELRNEQREVYASRYGAGGFDASSGAYAWNRSAASDPGSRSASSEDGRRTITRSEEELDITKRETNRGEARIGKHVETEHVREPVTRRREELVVERRPVEAGARGDASLSDDEVRIPLMEEEVIVEKRPVVKEELVVGKRIVEERDVVETDVRREQFDIDESVTRRGPNRNER